MINIFNKELVKELKKLRLDFEQYKYDQCNLPKYKEGEILQNGTIIIKVWKCDKPYSFMPDNFPRAREYIWLYKGVFNNEIIGL